MWGWAHSGMDKFEDPIKMSEQGVRDLKKNLQASMVSLAQVKSLAIRLQKETDDHKKRGADYERKAMLLLKRMQGGDMEGTETERLATQALSKKEEALQSAATASEQQQAQQRMADQLQTKVEELKRQIGLVPGWRRTGIVVEPDRLSDQAVVGVQHLQNLREGVRVGSDSGAEDFNGRMRSVRRLRAVVHGHGEVSALDRSQKKTCVTGDGDGAGGHDARRRVGGRELA